MRTKHIKYILLAISTFVINLTNAETHTFYGVMSVDVDNNIYELRNDSDKYTKQLPTQSSTNGYYSIIFQQKGLGQIDTTALKKFSRILIAVTDMPHGTYQCCDEEPQITPEITTKLYAECDRHLETFEYLPYCKPSIDIFQTPKGYYVTRVRFARTGNEGEVIYTIYRLQNSRHSAIITTSYRVSNADEFRDCIDKTINSFEWETEYHKPTNDHSIYISIAALIGLIAIPVLFFINKK